MQKLCDLNLTIVVIQLEYKMSYRTLYFRSREIIFKIIKKMQNTKIPFLVIFDIRLKTEKEQSTKNG